MIRGTAITVLIWAALSTLGGALAQEDACPKRAYGSPLSFRQSVDQAELIVLAKATEARRVPGTSGVTVEFEFHVREAIKGDAGPRYMIVADLDDNMSPRPSTHFDNHKDMIFWDRLQTRLGRTALCNDELTFELGQKYVLFDPHKPQTRDPLTIAFEKVDEDYGDQWLNAVRQMSGDAGQQRGLQMDAVSYLAAHRSVTLIVVENCFSKLREDAYRLAQISEPIRGELMYASDIDPERFANALEGCSGLTALLGLFYEPSNGNNEIIAGDARPAQTYLPIVDGVVDFENVKTEIEITGPLKITLDDLIAGVRDS